ncbi:MAG: DUF3089 domain-containing protein [Marinicaulis sp.]|nr:DUF3089 domain-containing protein [Marinicaulis sp.]
MNPWRISIGFGAFLAITLLAAAALIFQDNLARYALNPKFPYQTYAPPPPPAYGARGAWALWPNTGDSADADVFYVHSTTYYGAEHWNAPINDEGAAKELRDVAAPNEAGPFLGLGNVYGPKYRQATLFASFTHKFDGRAAYELAFSDVSTAFEHFLNERAEGRPMILVGYGQGGLHVLGLLQRFFENDANLRAQLSAAYIIDHSIPVSIFEDELSNVPACSDRDTIGCVVSYIAFEERHALEQERFRKRTLIWNDGGTTQTRSREEVLCVNPLSWTISEKRVGAENHLGAASATGLPISDMPAPIPGSVTAQCNRGILTVEKPKQAFLQRKRWFGGHWRAQDYNLFFHDLRADAERRIANTKITGTQEISEDN